LRLQIESGGSTIDGPMRKAIITPQTSLIGFSRKSG
jgi:hypothetical protein